MFEEKFIELIEKRDKANKLSNAWGKIQKKAQDADDEFQKLTCSLNKLMCDSGIEAVPIQYKEKDFLFVRNITGDSVSIMKICSPKEADKLAAINKMKGAKKEEENKSDNRAFEETYKQVFETLKDINDYMRKKNNASL